MELIKFHQIVFYESCVQLSRSRWNSKTILGYLSLASLAHIKSARSIPFHLMRNCKYPTLSVQPMICSGSSSRENPCLAVKTFSDSNICFVTSVCFFLNSSSNSSIKPAQSRSSASSHEFSFPIH